MTTTKRILAALLLALTNTIHAAVPADGHYKGTAKLSLTIPDLELASKSAGTVTAVVRSGTFGAYDREVIVLGPEDRNMFGLFATINAPTSPFIAHILFNSITGAAEIDSVYGQITSSIQGNARSLRVTFTTTSAAADVGTLLYGATVSLMVNLVKQ